MTMPFGTFVLAAGALISIPIVLVVAAVGLVREIRDWKK